MTGPLAAVAADQFNAVADPQQANRFTAADVVSAWQGFVGTTGRLPGGSGSQPFTNGQDRPLKGSAIDVGTAGFANEATGANSQDQTLTKQNGLWRIGQQTA